MVISQNDSKIGRFSADFVKGCAPLTVNLTVNDSFGNIVRQYIYEDGSRVTNDTFHTFTVADTFNIIQVVQSQLPRTDTLEVIVYDPATPTFEIFNCSLNRARILPTTDFPYDFYRVYFENDSLTVLPNQVSEIMNFSNSAVKLIRLRGFFNNARNNCGEVSFNFNPIDNIDIPIISDFTAIQHCLNLSAIDLDVTITPAVRHLLEVSTDQINFEVIDTISDVSSINVTDIPINSETICVRIVAIDDCDNTRIESQVICDNSLSTQIPIVNDVTATFTIANTLSLDWVASPIIPINYEITRALRDESFSIFALSERNSFSNSETYDGQRVFDFRIVPIDSCGNQANSSILTRPIFLRAERNSTNNYDFEWNNYLGWQNGQTGVTYELEILGEGNSVNNSIPITNNSFTRNIGRDNGTRFRVKGMDNNRNRQVFSNIIVLEQENEILTPTAFTPNGDGVNDVFGPIVTDDVENFEMLIFNRWGEVIFVSRSRLIGWDGKDQRGNAQNGTYTYKISFNEENGNIFNQTGTFVLIK